MNQRKSIHVTLLAGIAALTLIAGTASRANAGSFDGPFAQLGMGFASLGTTQSFNGPDINGNPTVQTYKQSQVGILGNIAAGYSFQLSGSLNIAANVFYSFGSQNAGQLTDSFNAVKYQNKLKNIWGITVEPGYNFTDKSLGFFKLGWVMASTSLRYTDPGLSETNNGGITNGFLYGVGFKQLVTEHVYISFEAYQAVFSSKNATNADQLGLNSTLLQPNFTYGGINIGYKF